MELVEGSDLDSHPSWEYPIETPQFQIIRGILIQMCRALEYIHAQESLLSLKPSNVYLLKWLPFTDFVLSESSSLNLDQYNDHWLEQLRLWLQNSHRRRS